MNIGDYYNRNVPDYYPYMYLDGYTPDQIMYAHHKMMRKQIEEHIQKKQQKQQKPEPQNIKITCEVKVKK